MTWDRPTCIVSVCCVCALLFAAHPGSAGQSESGIDSPAHWKAGQAALAKLGDGFIVWESFRTGRWRLWTIKLDGTGLRQLSPEEPGRDHYCPHISPDGSKIVYLSYPKGSTAYEPVPLDQEVPLHLIKSDGSGDTIIAPNASSYYEDRAVVWFNNEEICYIDPTGVPFTQAPGQGGTVRSGFTYQLNIKTGKREKLTEDRNRSGYLINATKTYATSGNAEFAPYDPVTKRIPLRAKMRGGCQPYLTQDGVWGYWMMGVGGPIARIHLATQQDKPILRRGDPRMPKERNYLYFPHYSVNNRLLAFGAMAQSDQACHFKSDWDIFVAQTDPNTLELVGDPVRYTFDPACDRFPDVWQAESTSGSRENEAAQRPNKLAVNVVTNVVTVDTLAWSPSRDGLIFLWQNNKSPNLTPVGGSREEISFLLDWDGVVRFDHNHALILGRGRAWVPEDLCRKMVAPSATTGLTVEATLYPKDFAQSGPAAIITDQTTFTLGQERGQLVIQLKTMHEQKEKSHRVSLGTLSAGGANHVLVSFTSGCLAGYINGVRVKTTDEVKGDFSHWTRRSLSLGAGGDNGAVPWAGNLEGIAIYGRALSPKEAGAHYESYKAVMAARKRVERLEIRAKLKVKSAIPTLRQIQPYRQALVLYEYAVTGVLGGKYPEKKIRVAHWVILNGNTLPISQAKEGTETKLVLEPYADNPQLESLYLSDSLEASPEPLFFDVASP